jgi:hypothetical protein
MHHIILHMEKVAVCVPYVNNAGQPYTYLPVPHHHILSDVDLMGWQRPFHNDGHFIALFITTPL